MMYEAMKENILLAYNQVVGAERIVEVRMLNTTKGTISGYYNDPYKLIQDITPYIGENDIFITANPPKKALLARADNRLVPHSKKTTSDNDIETREWLIIDIDPVRPAGISATEEEKQAAVDLAHSIRHYLEEENGWTEPIVADSGNGIHLLYPIDLDNDKETSDLIASCLKALDFLFSNEQAKVDITTFNAARIIKLYGTIATKGDSTVDRPHRQSYIISYPEEQYRTPLEQLKALAQHLPQDPEPPKNGAKEQRTIFDVDEFLARHNIAISSRGEWNGGTRWVLSSCPWNPEHTDHSAFVTQFPNGALAAGCHHSGCAGENWHTLRAKFEPNRKSGKKKQGDSQEETQAEALIRLAEVVEFFHTPTEEGWATVPIGQYKRNLKINSRQFKSWLTKAYFDETKKPPSSEALNQAIALIESKALFEGKEHKLYLRVAEYKGTFYYDLADKEGQVIEITPNGYQISQTPPPVFRRSANMVGQVVPARHGNILLLKKHLRSKTLWDEILLVVTIVSYFIPNIAHPIIVTAGEKGAAKTTSMSFLRRIIDPASRDLFVLPKGEMDMAHILCNNYAPFFDNIEFITAMQSDMLCRAITGGGTSKRALYTDMEDVILEFRNCISINGINVVATRSDLLDRSIINELERIPKHERKEERVVWQEFEADLPTILAGIFEVMSKAMKLYPEVDLTSLPRMADYCRWGYAIAEVIGYGGESFLQAYENNLNRANDSVINDDPIAAAIVAFMRERTEWDGYVSQLFDELEQISLVEKISCKSERWPKRPHILTLRMKQVKSNLEGVGIAFEHRKDKQGTIVQLRKGADSTSSRTVKRKIAISNRQNELAELFNEV